MISGAVGLCQSRRDNGLRAPARGLARPDGTVTRLSSQGTDYGGKQIELLGEIVPGLNRIASSPTAIGAPASNVPPMLLARADELI
jgi:hypothetical protein